MSLSNESSDPLKLEEFKKAFFERIRTSEQYLEELRDMRSEQNALVRYLVETRDDKGRRRNGEDRLRGISLVLTLVFVFGAGAILFVLYGLTSSQPSPPPPPSAAPPRADYYPYPSYYQDGLDYYRGQVEHYQKQVEYYQALLAGSGMDDRRVVQLLFATNRKLADQRDRVTFSYERNDSLTFGAAHVRIPEDHKVGEITLPKEYSLFSISLFKEHERPAEHFIIRNVSLLSRDQFTRIIGQAENKTALVFVPGFNNTFDDGVYRLAQIVWDLQFDGIPVLFSWPAHGDNDGMLTGISSYLYDQDSALGSRQLLGNLLELLQVDAKINTVHIVAHSMGNLVMLEALDRAAREGAPIKLSEVIMAAPDVDRDRFRDLASHIQRVASGMTLYASSRDLAMVAARTIAKAPRAGDVPEAGPIVVPNVDTIDVSALGTELFGLRHNTFATDRSLINDIGLVLRGLRPPHLRTVTIRGKPDGAVPPQYWSYAN
jgi:esterase/lipase superfamily enzyme